MTDVPRIPPDWRGAFRPSRVAAVAIALALLGAALIVAGWLAPPPPVAELQTQVVVDVRR